MFGSKPAPGLPHCRRSHTAPIIAILAMGAFLESHHGAAILGSSPARPKEQRSVTAPFVWKLLATMGQHAHPEISPCTPTLWPIVWIASIVRTGRSVGEIMLSSAYKLRQARC